MIVSGATQIELVNPDTNEVEWTGPWSEFLAANDEDVLSPEEGDVLASTGSVFIGGGAQAEVCVRIAAVRS